MCYGCFFGIFKLLCELLDLPGEGVDNLEDGHEVAILDNMAPIDGLVAVRARDLLAGLHLDQFLHAGPATGVLVHAHHHRRVLLAVELTQTEEALSLHLAPQKGLDLFTEERVLELLHHKLPNILLRIDPC